MPSLSPTPLGPSRLDPPTQVSYFLFLLTYPFSLISIVPRDDSGDTHRVPASLGPPEHAPEPNAPRDALQGLIPRAIRESILAEIELQLAHLRLEADQDPPRYDDNGKLVKITPLLFSNRTFTGGARSSPTPCKCHLHNAF